MKKQLEKLIAIHSRNNMPVTLTTGTAVNVTDTKCDVEREGLATLKDVWLNVIEEVSDKVTIVPKKNSVVLVATPDAPFKAQAVVISCSEIEKVLLTIGTTSLEIDKDGHEIKRGKETLAKILEDFMQELQNVIVVQGTSPNVPGIEAIKKRMKTILK